MDANRRGARLSRCRKRRLFPLVLALVDAALAEVGALTRGDQPAAQKAKARVAESGPILADYYAALRCRRGA
jgi:hypothetical protein